MNRKLKILFITPYAGYTGSEMMLWYLLAKLDKSKFEVQLFACRNGELLTHFSKDIKVTYTRANTSLIARITDKFLKKLKLRGLEERQLLKLNRSFKPDLWYINTMAINNVVSVAIKHKIKYVVHFHELLTQYASISNLELNLMVKDAFWLVGCSKKVCENLKTLGAKNIHMQYECVDLSLIKNKSDLNIKFRNRYKIKETDFVVVMSGQRIERKGFDIFIETAIRLKEKNYFFLWLGSSKNSGYDFFLENQIIENDLRNISIIAPSQSDYYDHMNLADVFFLTSREDPFPLVMIEAAFLGKPILSFRSGGSEEFVTEDIGMILPDFTEKTIDKGLELINHMIEKKHYVKDNIVKRAEEFDVKNQVKIFEKWMTNMLLDN